MKRSLRLTASPAVVAALLSAAAAEEPDRLYPVLQGGKSGYIDRAGRYVWRPTK